MQVLEVAQVPAHDDEVHAAALLDLKRTCAQHGAASVEDAEREGAGRTGGQRRGAGAEVQVVAGRRGRGVVDGRRLAGVGAGVDRAARDRGQQQDGGEQRRERRDADARRHDTSVYPASSTAAWIALSSKDSPATVSCLL